MIVIILVLLKTFLIYHLIFWAIRFGAKHFPYCRMGYHYGKVIHKDYGDINRTYFNCHQCGELVWDFDEDQE